MITRLRLKFGRAPGIPSEPIETTPVTVFVGPNNSGKSKILAEIDQYCQSGQKNNTYLILEDLAYRGFTADAASQIIDRISVAPNPGEAVHPGHILVQSKRGRNQYSRKMAVDSLVNPEVNPVVYSQYFLTHLTLMLDGPGRINLVTRQHGGDLQMVPQTSLQVLFRDDVKRYEVRRIIHDAFNSYFVIDPTQLGYLRIKLSDRAPANDLEERGLHQEAVQFHANAQSIELASDGVKAFTGIISELVAGDPSVLLIDEPEAFLHPSLASKLGYEISRAAVSANKSVFASTHSPSFVMGCIQSGAPVNIVRLTYRGGVATARLLPSQEILELMRNPLLRSTGVLSGLFYEFVVVTESDADRAFYQEVNERLLRFKPEWGIPNCLFLNAQNKQTIHTIIRPLRKLGIPAVGIVDVDIIKDGGTNWINLLDGAHFPAITQQPLAVLRAAVKEAAIRTGHDMKKDGGVSILASDDQDAARNLFDQLSDYGVFVVPGGELESWLRGLAATRHGPSWLIDIFQKMGEDPDAANYIKPSDGDVWKFMSEIKAWLANPMRKGIPS